MDLVSGFPKLSLTLMQLSLSGRGNDVNFGDVSCYKLSDTCCKCSGWFLPYFNICWCFPVKIIGHHNTADTVYALHSYHNTVSLIQQATVTCTWVQLSNVNDFNLFYNNLEGAHASVDSGVLITSKISTN